MQLQRSIDAATTAIACASGGFKGVFVSGVLAAFEQAGLRAAAYGAVSSTVLPTACAAIGAASLTGPDYWRRGLTVLDRPGSGMSEVVLGAVGLLSGSLLERMFAPGAPRFLIGTSAVVTAEAAEQTQGDRARRLGQQLLVMAGRGDKSWAEKNLALWLFDSAGDDLHRLDAHNFGAATYASTRMLHAWKIPASVGGAPFVDGTYTCSCPALELAELGYRDVIAISTEPAPLYHDLFARDPLPDSSPGATIHLIAPDSDLKTLGVDFTAATDEGLARAYERGMEKGERFLAERVRRP